MIISLRYRIAKAPVSPGGTLLCKLTAQRNSAGVVGKGWALFEAYGAAFAVQSTWLAGVLEWVKRES